MALLGLSTEKTLYNWKGQPEKARLTRDLLERASYILGIHQSLQILLPDPALADHWLATPNDNPLSNGTAPLDRVYGEGASWIMAAFTHPPVDGRSGRFNLDFGIYYCAPDEEVAVAESSFHRARFLRESRIEKTTQEMRVIRAQLGPATLHDVRQLAGHAIYHPDDYGAAQQLGRALRTASGFTT